MARAHRAGPLARRLHGASCGTRGLPAAHQQRAAQCDRGRRELAVVIAEELLRNSSSKPQSSIDHWCAQSRQRTVTEGAEAAAPSTKVKRAYTPQCGQSA